MGESEQAINVSEWKELHAELEEVSDKRNRLQTENNRLKNLIELTRKECDEVKDELVKMTAERDGLACQVQELQAELQLARKHLKDKLRFEAQLEAARKFADKLQVDLGYCRCEHDAAREGLAQAKEAADMFAAENTSLQDTVRQLRAKQIHDDLPGILRAIQLAAEQARDLI